eukprot:1918881-Rhodomonas_salina.2
MSSGCSTGSDQCCALSGQRHNLRCVCGTRARGAEPAGLAGYNVTEIENGNFPPIAQDWIPDDWWSD